MFGPPDDTGLSTPGALRDAGRAGRTTGLDSADVAGACCTTPWVSKGYPAGARAMAALTLDRAWRWTEAGRLPLVTDASSCAQGLHELAPLLDDARRRQFESLTVLDSVDFVHDELLPRLTPIVSPDEVARWCSMRRVPFSTPVTPSG